MEWEKMVERLTALLNAGKHSELRGALMMLNEVDIAHFMESLDKEKLLLCFRVLPKDISADVFAYMSAEQKQTLIESIGDNEIRSLIEDMFLDDTVDYADVYKVIREEMDKPSNLMENVAWRIVKGIAARFPEFIRFQIRISKSNPPVGGACQWSRVTVSYPHEPKAGKILDRKW